MQQNAGRGSKAKCAPHATGPPCTSLAFLQHSLRHCCHMPCVASAVRLVPRFVNVSRNNGKASAGNIRYKTRLQRFCVRNPHQSVGSVLLTVTAITEEFSSKGRFAVTIQSPMFILNITLLSMILTVAYINLPPWTLQLPVSAAHALRGI